MDRAGWNKILPIRRGRKPEEGKFKKALGEEDGAKKIAYSNRQDQINSITPLGLKGVCVAAGVPLIQVPAKSGYVISEVKRLIPRHLIIKDTPDQEPAPTPQKQGNNGKVCPNCSAFMVKRVAKNGKHVGKQFWACSAYPSCKTMEAVSPSS